jgi:hypothetical protein
VCLSVYVRACLCITTIDCTILSSSNVFGAERSAQVKRKITKDGFINMTRGVNDNKDLPRVRACSLSLSLSLSLFVGVGVAVSLSVPALLHLHLSLITNTHTLTLTHTHSLSSPFSLPAHSHTRAVIPRGHLRCGCQRRDQAEHNPQKQGAQEPRRRWPGVCVCVCVVVVVVVDRGILCFKRVLEPPCV